jgi:hypothetical protein
VTPDADFSGSEILTLKVKDSGSGAFPYTDEIDITLVVDHVNSPPVINSEPVTTILQGANYNYTLLASDVDGDSLIYAADEVPDWLTFNSSTHRLTGTAEQGDIGIHPVLLSVSDGEEQVTQEFQIEVVDANDPPVIVSPSTVQASEDMYFTFSVMANDPDQDELTYEILQLPGWLQFNANVHTLSGIPTNDDVGIYNLIVKVSDGSVVITEPLEITVLNMNDLPVITSTPDINAGVGLTYIYRLTAEDMDEGDVLSYSALNLPTWLNFTTSSVDALIYGIPTAQDYGSHLVILQVSDSHSEVLQAFTLKVTFPNGMEEPQKINHFIYPNPAKNSIFLEIMDPDEVNIRIINAAGHVVIEKICNGMDLIELDVSSLPQGIYFYHLSMEGKISRGKFLKN